MKKFFYLAPLMMMFFAGIIYAGSGGGQAGGSGGGKGCSPGSEDPTNAWQSITCSNYFDSNSYPGGLVSACGSPISGMFPDHTNFGGGTNTYPTVNPTILGSNDYFCHVLVQDLSTGETRQQEAYITSSSYPIEVPKFHSFRVNFSFITKCSECVSPLLITLSPGEGRRILWNGIQDFPAGSNYISISSSYSGLTTCQ